MAKRKAANGEGTIYQRRGKWCAELMIGFTPDGKKKRIRGTFETRKEAARWLADQISSRSKGTLVEPSKETVAELVSRWLEKTAPTEVGPSTLRLYTNVFTWYVNPHLGSAPISKLRPEHIQDMQQAILKAGKSPRTAQLARIVLRRALQQAVEWGQLPKNPVDRVKPPRQERQNEGVRALTPEQLAAFIEAAKRERLHALFILAATTGMRQGELLALRWQDVDLASGILRVNQTMKVVLEKDSHGNKHERWTFGQTKTIASRRTIVLPEVAVAALRKWKAEQNQEKLLLGDAEAWEYPDLVFTTAIGTPLSPNNIRKRDFRRILEAAGLPRIRFHDLRHSAVTFMLSKGIKPEVVQEIVGHSTFTTTLRIYRHVLDEEKKEAARKVDAFLAAAKKKVL